MTFKLIDLPYSKDALAPYMSAETLDFHHGKHHNTYVTNLNGLIKDTDLASLSLEEIILKSYKNSELAGVYNNAGQIYNHNMFWQLMSSPEVESKPSDKFMALVNKSFGSFESFREEFIKQGTTVFGSGWVWCYLEGDSLKIGKYQNADNPLVHGATPLIGCDVWEHSYYIDYRNARPKYLEVFFDKLLNWDFINKLV